MKDYDIKFLQSIEEGDVYEVSIPEDSLDEISMNVLSEDTPDFIVPFIKKEINNQVVLRYRTGNEIPLKYRLRGIYDIKEKYIGLGLSLIEPFITAKEWLTDYHYLCASTDYVFEDKNTGKIRFLCIPDKRMSTTDADIEEFLGEALEKPNVKDGAEFEMEVFRFLKDEHFNIRSLYSLFTKERAKQSEGAVPVNTPYLGNVQKSVAAQSPHDNQNQIKRANGNTGGSELFPQAANNYSPSAANSYAAQNSINNSHVGPSAAPQTAQNPPQMGTGAVNPASVSSNNNSAVGELFGKSTKKGTAKKETGKKEKKSFFIGAGIRKSGGNGSGKAKMLLTESPLPNAPQVIDLSFPAGQLTIGRISREMKPDIPFPEEFKWIGRRHAMIEKDRNGKIYIIDLGSANHTFLNGQELAPNQRYELTNGAVVSFASAQPVKYTVEM